MSRIVVTCVTLVVSLATLVACGGSNDATTTTNVSAVDAATATTVVAADATTPTVTSAETANSTTVGAKVSANNATRAELTAAFTAAGVSSPARWAKEVEEYRPYDDGDATFASLKQNLAKYNIDPAVEALIISTLSLP
jgi:hypothetical protein